MKSDVLRSANQRMFTFGFGQSLAKHWLGHDFRVSPDLERIAGTDDGAVLLDAVTAVLDRPDRVALLERTRAEIHGLTISELCEAKGWHRPWFYKRTDAAAKRVAAYLNQHGGQDVDAVQEVETAPVI